MATALTAAPGSPAVDGERTALRVDEDGERIPSGSACGGTTTCAPSPRARPTVSSISLDSMNSCTSGLPSGGVGQIPPSSPPGPVEICRYPSALLWWTCQPKSRW